MVKVKICGIKTMQDVQAVNKHRPDYAGFVFYPLSKRYVSLIIARRLKVALNKHIKTVGVFVNAPTEEIAAAAELGIIDLVQLHGDEGNAYIAELKKSASCPSSKRCKCRMKTTSNAPIIITAITCCSILTANPPGAARAGSLTQSC